MLPILPKVFLALLDQFEGVSCVMDGPGPPKPGLDACHKRGRGYFFMEKSVTCRRRLAEIFPTLPTLPDLKRFYFAFDPL